MLVSNVHCNRDMIQKSTTGECNGIVVFQVTLFQTTSVWHASPMPVRRGMLESGLSSMADYGIDHISRWAKLGDTWNELMPLCSASMLGGRKVGGGWGLVMMGGLCTEPQTPISKP
jgi:hypothetical protein